MRQNSLSFTDTLQIIFGVVIVAAVAVALTGGLIWGIETARARVWAKEIARVGCICPPNAP